VQDASARGLFAGLGGCSGLSRDIVVHVSQGVESVAHPIVHSIARIDGPATPIGPGEGPGALFERPSLAAHGSLDGLAHWRLPRRQSAPSSAKESDPVRAQSVLALEDLDFLREDIDLRCAWTAIPCPWLDERGQ